MKLLIGYEDVIFSEDILYVAFGFIPKISCPVTKWPWRSRVALTTIKTVVFLNFRVTCLPRDWTIFTDNGVFMQPDKQDWTIYILNKQFRRGGFLLNKSKEKNLGVKKNKNGHFKVSNSARWIRISQFNFYGFFLYIKCFINPFPNNKF